MVFDYADIRRALDEDEFFPVFQPQVELRTGQLTGFEILARWNHKELGLIAPDDFIPAVEKSGLIDNLSRTLLAMAFASPVLADGTLTLAVNISPAQLLGVRLPERIAAVAEQGGFPLDRLTIEITESALLDDLPRAQAVAAELKALRCKLALDDFGSGYSSLRHLHVLPFDELKVDRSFVSSMTEKRESRKIVAAVMGLGQSLGLGTVAEGVETQEQANMLLWLGCDLGQGWLYGRPVQAEKLRCIVTAVQRHNPIAIPAPLDEGSITSLEVLPAQRLAQLQAIYDGAPVGLCFLDRNMRYVSINRRLAQMNGVAVAAHLGRTVAEVIPLTFPKVEGFIRRAMQGEPVSGVEIQKPRADGGNETLMLSYQPARDEAGEVLGVSVAVMDITGRKRTEEALLESENHYRHMVQLNPHVPWVLNARGEVIEASPRWETFTGQKMDEALGNGWVKMLHPDDAEPTQEAIQASLRSGLPIDIEYRVRRPDGSWTWMRSRGSPRFGPSGKIICIYGVVEEVHSRKQMTEELLAWEFRLRAAMDAVPIGIVLADAQDCTIFMANPTAKKILEERVFPGQKLDEYTRLGMARPDGELLSPDEYPVARALLRGETVSDKRLLYTRADGSRTHLSVSSKPIFADDGQLIGAVLMIRDLDTKD